MLACLMESSKGHSAMRKHTPTAADGGPDDEGETMDAALELLPTMSTLVLSRIASFMTSPDSCVLAVSRYAIHSVECVGDTLEEGSVLHSANGNQVRFSGLHTTDRNIVVTTEEGISVLTAPTCHLNFPSDGLEEEEEEEEGKEVIGKEREGADPLYVEGRTACSLDSAAPAQNRSARGTRAGMSPSLPTRPRGRLSRSREGGRRSRGRRSTASFSLSARRRRGHAKSPSPYQRWPALRVVAEKEMNHPSEQIHSIACSPDGYFIAVGTGNASVSVFGCDTGTDCQGMDCLGLEISVTQTSSRSGQLSSGEEAPVPQLSLLYELLGHTDCVKHLKLTKDPAAVSRSSSCGESEKTTPVLLYSAGDDGRICVWDLATGELRSCVKYSERGFGVFEVSFTSGLIAIASNKPMLVVYRAADHSLETMKNASFPREAGPFFVHTYRRRVSEEEGRETTGGYDVKEIHECPRLQLDTETLITGAHNGTPTAAKFTHDSQWMVSAGEDEVVTISSISEPRRIFQCLEGLTRRSCFALFNLMLSVCVLASPPTSSVIIVLAGSSDGTLIQWVVDPRDGRSAYTKKTQLKVGTLMAVDVQERVPQRLFYF